MNKTALAATLLLLSSCDSHDDDHDHGHGHDAAHDEPEHAHGEGDHDAPAPAATPAIAEPVEAKLGEGLLRLMPTADRLILTHWDASGSPLAPEGEVRVVLTPTGGEEQRIVLTSDGGGWSGAASAVGASGYVAVVSLKIDGQTLTARLAWGDAPTAPATEAAPETPEDAHEDGEHGHGHGHGH